MLHKIEKLKKLKLLFVEDEAELLNILCSTLEKLNANFILAKNGEEALKVLEEHKDIDIIITDINMPVMNGLELIKTVKETRNTPFIITSAHTEKEYIDKAKELGVDHYLLKPFDFIKFLDLIYKIEL